MRVLGLLLLPVDSCAPSAESAMVDSDLCRFALAVLIRIGMEKENKGRSHSLLHLPFAFVETLQPSQCC